MINNIENIKYSELYIIKMLEDKLSLLVNHKLIDFNYANYYNENYTLFYQYLINNQNMINKLYEKNKKNILIFSIIMSYNDLFKEELELLNEIDFELFCSCINTIPFKFLKKREQNKLIKLYNEFININDLWLKYVWFERHKRM